MLAVVIESALRGSILLVLTWAVLKALRLRDFAAEKNVWTVMALASLTMPLLAWAIAFIAPPLAMLPTHPAMSPATLRLMNPGLTVSSGAQVGLIVYLLGTTAWVARFITGLWLGARLRRGARTLPELATRSFDVRVSTRVRTPASFAATILLPCDYESWDPPMLAAVLAHEGAHIRNRDCHRMWLVAVYRAIFWFNPLAHLLYRRLQMLSELTSDEAAATAIGDRASYADVLRRVASTPAFFSGIIAMATHGTLSQRLKTLVDESLPRAPKGRRHNALLTIAMLILIALAAVPAGRATTLAAQGIASLEFYLVDERNDAYQAQRTGRLPSGDRLYEDRNGRPVLLRRQVAVKPTQVSMATTENGIAVQIQLDERNAALMLRTTRENIGNRMAVVYVEPAMPAGKIISDAVIRGAFGSQFAITGLTDTEAKALASQVGQSLTH
jgi:beta-lactamase regulating signal transducer with metallopeptidase domain